MNSPNSSKSVSPPLPNLSAPNKTFAARKSPRRSSTLSSNSPVSPVSSLIQSPFSPSNELPEAFSTTSPPLQQPQQHQQQQQSMATTTASGGYLRQTIASTTSSLLRKASDVAHASYFTPTQLAALKTLCSAVPLQESDPSFWANLLENKKYPAVNSQQEAYDLEMETVGLSIELAANNPRTRNFTKLLLHLLDEIHQCDVVNTESISVKLYNALFITRIFSKHFASNLSNAEIIQQFDADDGTSLASAFKNVSIDSDTGQIAEKLLDTLFNVVINMNPCQSYSAYEFYIEILNTLIIFMSTQLHHPRITDENYFIDIITSKLSDRSQPLVAKLLQNVIEQKIAPPQSSSMVYNAYSYFFPGRSGSVSDTDIPPVADRSLLLLLLLAAQPGPLSPFRVAFKSLRDHHDLSLSLDNTSNIDTKLHLIPFKDLFEIFCRNIGVEEQMLLFYFMLTENEPFRVYVLSRTDPETLYIPILKMIYEAAEGDTNYPHVYVLLIILLLLSQDDMNNNTVQKVNVHNLTWITERTVLKSLSLGNLLFLVMIRMLQFNLSHQRDIYLHTNCLGILINMSRTALDIHSYVAQKLTSLLELVSKRQQKVAKRANTPIEHTSMQDIAVYEDMLSLLLEIINSILKHRLKNNSQLVYAVLLKQEIFVPLREHERLSGQIKKLDEVISYFSTRVAEANLKAPSTSEILNLIDQASRTWTPKVFEAEPGLAVQYKENEDSHEFFIPYCWELIHRRPFLPWSEEKAHILDDYRILRYYPQARNSVS